MPLRVRYALTALVELDDLYTFIYAANPDRAPTYIHELRAALDDLAASPFPLAIARERPALAPRVRFFGFGTSKAHKRIIVVEITDTTLTVVRVLGGSMDLLKRMKGKTP